jgi:cytochrome c biogenesis protein CcdA
MTTEEKNSGTDHHESRGAHSAKADTPQLMRNIFGIFMVLVYVGMGILIYMNFFGWTASFAWVRYVMGTLFIIYGIWRGYRQARVDY